MTYTQAILIVMLIMLLYIWKEYDMLKMNMICILSINRGILSPNKFWWSITDLILQDKSGVELFYKVKKKHRYFYRTNLLTTPMILVLNIDVINKILDNSPDIFGVGAFKYNFFKSFMINNVGIQKGEKWKLLRSINENVLDFGQTHRYADEFNKIINNSLSDVLPLNFYDFNVRAKEITSKIVFGNICLHQNSIYDTLIEANKLPIFPQNSVPSYNKSRCYIDKTLKNPKQCTLTDLLATYGKNISDYCKSDVLADQIYHFIFPMIALITIHVPRILALIFTHPEVKNKLFQCLQTQEQAELYLRKCILETLRLNSPVTSFFRKSSCPVLGFPKHTEFLILTNPILKPKFAEHE